MFNPLNIEEDLFPCVVFSDDSTGLFSFLIRWRTKGMYNHAMIAPWPGEFASQSISKYAIIPMGVYLKRGIRLKFIGINLTQMGKKAILSSIKEKDSRPKIEKFYDFLAIFGQTVGFTWIQNPYKDFCSEDVVKHLKKAIPYEPESTAEALKSLPDHGSPEAVNKAMKAYQGVFSVIGRWQYD